MKIILTFAVAYFIEKILGCESSMYHINTKIF